MRRTQILRSGMAAGLIGAMLVVPALFGVIVNTTADGSMFGTERMRDALNRDRDAAPEQILQQVRSAGKTFVKDAEQFDDLTMLCQE